MVLEMFGGLLIFFLICWSDAAQQSKTKFIDFDAPEFETFLSPTDFLAMTDSVEVDSNSSAMYNPDLFEGDIANELNATTVSLFLNGGLTSGQKDDVQLNAIRDRRQLWKNGRIPYALSNQYTAQSRAIIAKAMEEYSKFSCIQWSPRTLSDTDYVYIVPLQGCYSMWGELEDVKFCHSEMAAFKENMSRKQLEIREFAVKASIAAPALMFRIILHEMLHCVGLFHEQSRSDRDSYVNILYNNIQPGMQSQFEKYSPVTIQNLGTSYDYSSIMHYGPTAFSRNGLPTIVPKTQNAQIGQRHGFSQTDVYKINTLYECTPSQPTAATSQPVVTFATTTPSIQTSTTAAPLTNCVNRRPDCKQLADDGWCDRNSKYMRDYCCQTYSSTCSPLTSKTGGSTNKVCEDLRVDCMEQIVKRRYCITAPKFAREVCSKSCGFCWPSVVDENNRATVVPSITAQTLQPIIPKTTTLYPPIVCRDKSFKCVYYKKLGYCIQGAYTKWMLTNCPNSCGVCRNLSPK